ncbi:polyamine ABC transporter substrate-binding protein [Dongia deserti]|uniref:polyamine ABC transporter substrate-binding protein n=1 Tax=Dongia deserti TaxID=2268030 RepID=UPI00254713FD|nr:polyamine ABC transporter substrate-binding protein [Dongia deserti]
MKFTRFGVVAFISALLLAACGEEKKEEQAAAPAQEQPAQEQPAQPTQEQTATTEPPSTAPATGDQQAATSEPAAAAGSGGELNVYNWSDYIGETTVEDFQKETGITVRYDVYDSNETLEAKLMAGNTGYDLVVPSGSFLGRQIQAGIYQEIDKSKLTNYGNLDPQILKALESFDPGNKFGVPYFWGTVGIGYNVDKVKERLGENAPVDSLDLLFKPENASKLQDCGIAMLDAPSDMFQTTLNYLGKDPHTKSEEDYAAVEQMFAGIRQYVKYFHSSQYINDLANGEVCAVIGWSGDVFIAADRAEEAQNNVTIEYTIPKEGSLLWVDSLAIPKDAKNVENAHKFIDYLLDPQVAANGVNYVSYASPNTAALEFVEPDIKDNPAIYPTEEVKKNLFPDAQADPELERLRTRTWTKIKTGQ